MMLCLQPEAPQSQPCLSPPFSSSCELFLLVLVCLVESNKTLTENTHVVSLRDSLLIHGSILHFSNPHSRLVVHGALGILFVGQRGLSIPQTRKQHPSELPLGSFALLKSPLLPCTYVLGERVSVHAFRGQRNASDVIPHMPFTELHEAGFLTWLGHNK